MTHLHNYSSVRLIAIPLIAIYIILTRVANTSCPHSGLLPRVAGGMQVYSVAGGMQVYSVAGGMQVYSVAGGVQVYSVANYSTCCFLLHLVLLDIDFVQCFSNRLI